MDVVIVGKSFAAPSAVIEAGNHDWRIVVYEKMTPPRGNSVIAGGGINAVGPDRQGGESKKPGTYPARGLKIIITTPI